MLDENHYCPYRVIKSYTSVQSALSSLLHGPNQRNAKRENHVTTEGNITSLGIERISTNAPLKSYTTPRIQATQDSVIRQNLVPT
jgi:hypothetical protein